MLFRSVPTDIQEMMSSHLSHADGYSDSKGILAAREAIADYCSLKGIDGVTPKDVYTGNGVSELIVMCMQGLLDDGDEILVPLLIKTTDSHSFFLLFPFPL